MNVLLTENSELLFNVAQRYGLSPDTLIKANPHLQNFHIVDEGEFLVIPSNTDIRDSAKSYQHSGGANPDLLYQLEPSEFHLLVNHSRFTRKQTEVITWTIVVSGGEALVTLAGTAGIAGITVVVGVAAVAGLAYFTSGEKNLRLNSATNVGVPPPSTPNASVNVNSNRNVGVTVLLSEMAKAKRRIESEFAITLIHLGHLQNGKGPDCLPGSQCYEDNKNHWKKEIKKFLNNAEKHLKNVRGKTKEALKNTIEQLRKEADKF